MTWVRLRLTINICYNERILCNKPSKMSNSIKYLHISTQFKYFQTEYHILKKYGYMRKIDSLSHLIKYKFSLSNLVFSWDSIMLEYCDVIVLSYPIMCHLAGDIIHLDTLLGTFLKIYINELVMNIYIYLSSFAYWYLDIWSWK